MAKTSKSSKATKPFTPMRRFFFKLELLGKRRREQFYDYDNLDPIVDTPPTPKIRPCDKENVVSDSPYQPASSDASSKPVRVALQNEDVLEDAIIITALDTIPFCCHEDLITMSREKLISVALALNAKLPSVLTIDTSHTRPTSFIRNSIEYIVGLRGEVPFAPKATRSRPELDINLSRNFDMRIEMDKSPPTSPLAKRSRASDLYSSMGSPRLERLEEEEEGPNDRGEADRPTKKRKISLFEQNADSDVDMEPELTPTPPPRLLRAHSHHAPLTNSPTPVRVLRSRSLKLERKSVIDTTFVNTKRPSYRYRYRGKAKDVRTGAVLKREHRAESLTPHRPTPRKARSLRPISGYHPFVAPGGDEFKDTGSVSANSSLSQMSVTVEDSPMSTASTFGRKRKGSLEQTEDEKAMTSGIGEISMGQSKSDMDVCT